MSTQKWESVTWDWIEREIVECLLAERQRQEKSNGESFVSRLANRSDPGSILSQPSPKAKREH